MSLTPGLLEHSELGDGVVGAKTVGSQVLKEMKAAGFLPATADLRVLCLLACFGSWTVLLWLMSGWSSF